MSNFVSSEINFLEKKIKRRREKKRKKKEKGKKKRKGKFFINLVYQKTFEKFEKVNLCGFRGIIFFRERAPGLSVYYNI